MAYVLIQRNVMAPHKGREQMAVNGKSILQVQKLANVSVNDLPTVCYLNGKPIPQSQWAKTKTKREDIVHFIKLPKGRGGGGSNVMRVIAIIAVVAAAAFLGPLAAGAMGFATTGAAATAFTAAFSIAGSFLVNALIPPPTPKLGGFGNTQEASPTYSLTGQGNQARLGQPIPVIYGRHIVYPDFGSKPFAEYVNNDQFLHQLHVIGQGEYDIETPRIEDTPITSFEEVTYEIVAPGNNITLFDPNVISAPEIAGQELKYNETVGAFIVNPAGTTATEISCDFVFPQGLYNTNDNGNLTSVNVTWQVEAMRIDDEGNEIGSWLTIGSESLTENDNTAQRLTKKYTLATPGRYKVRCTRTSAESTSIRVGDSLRWEGLKAKLDQTPDYGNVTLLAVKMRATNNLSQQSSRLINCIVTRKLPTWNPTTGWSTPTETSSIAWALADICKNTIYGGQLEDKNIDLNKLYTLDQAFTARGDEFNAVFDSKTVVVEALEKVSTCGRCKHFMQNGIVRFARDEQRTMPVAMFTPRNIVKDTFNMNIAMPSDDTADSVTVEFFNEETWKVDEETVTISGGTTEKPARVRYMGITNKNQALREGYYMAASNSKRRITGSFETELDGLIPTYGDLIHISHDMPDWGETGEIKAFDGTVFETNEPVTFEEGEDHYIWLRNRIGAPTGPYLVTKGDSNYELVLDENEDVSNAEIYTDLDAERTHFCFGKVGEAFERAIVTGVRPRGKRVEVGFVLEDDSVHTADNVVI